MNATTLESAALGGPIDEPFHLIAVFPHQTEKFGGIERGGFGSEERLEPPPEVCRERRSSSNAASSTSWLTYTGKRLYFLQNG